MVYELVSPQLTRNGAAPCTLCGISMNGLSCTCYSHAAWLYRASQGRIKTNGCHVRDLTNDCVGGTNLNQMEAVSTSYGITTGKRYQPIDFDQVAAWVNTGRYGSHLNICYAPFVGTPYDRFGGTFKGNHDIYLSTHGATAGTIRTMDPGIGTYHDIPTSLLKTAAGRLDLGGGATINSEFGGGKCYAYVTPADPATATTIYHFFIKSATPVYSSDSVTTKIGSVRSGSGTCTKHYVNGLLWWQIVKPATAGVLQPGRWLHAGPSFSVTH